MHKQSKFVASFLFIALGAFFLCPKLVSAETVDHLVISEVQVGGSTSVDDEFIELYNPTSNTINIEDWSIQYKGGTANTFSRKNFTTGAHVPAHGWYLITNSGGYDGSTASDMPQATISLANEKLGAGGNIFLVNNQSTLTSTTSATIVDKLGYGVADGAESTPALLPPVDQSTERKPGGSDGNGQDTNNNTDDFFLQTSPNPQNTQSSPQPPIETPPPLENHAPIAAAGIDQTATVDQTISFDGSGSSDPDVGDTLTYVWSFGDEGSAKGPTATHAYTSAGAYTVTLTVSDGNLPTSQDTLTVTVSEASSPTPVYASSDIVINEFAPATGDEWIELYNTTANSINLSGWTLWDGNAIKTGDPIVTLAAETIPATSDTRFFVVELPSNKLNNDGDIVILKDPSGKIIDAVAYGNWNDGNLQDNVPAVAQENSLARSPDGRDTDNDAGDFSTTIRPTKGQANLIIAPSAPTPSQTTGGSGGGNTAPALTYFRGNILINEFVAAPAAGSNEWIELYNTTGNSINLSGWTIEDGSETQTALTNFLDAYSFKIIENPKGKLNNDGDIIILFDPTGKIIDTVAYGNWQDGDISDNAPASAQPNALARANNSINTNNNFNDFKITSSPTKGTGNIIATPNNTVPTTPADSQNQTVYPDKIIINEFLPNPTGPDNDQEFIELKNTSSLDINLAGWQVSDNSAGKYIVSSKDFSSLIIKGGEFFVLYRKITGLALNNTGGDAVKLYNPAGTLVDSIAYTDPAIEAQSYSRGQNNLWAWSQEPTPGKANIINIANRPPKAVINIEKSDFKPGETIKFDASDSYDPENSPVTYLWTFGDGESSREINPAHIYNTVGNYQVNLTTKDNQDLANKAEVKIAIANTGGGLLSEINNNPDAVIISEILPNPSGEETGEWIELANTGSSPIDISNWKLDDEEGGSNAYKIPTGTIIPTNGFIVFPRTETKIALNNEGDAVRLVNLNNKVASQASYIKAPEGVSYALDINNQWQWTKTLTPGQANIITPVGTVKGIKITQQIIKTTMEEVRQVDLGETVQVQGMVAAPPGILGKQIFYLAGSGIQIYMYKADFPNLKLGDLVQVTGILAESQGERRIKVTRKSDIKIISHQDPPQPEVLGDAEINEELEGHLVKIAGEVVEARGNNITLDNGSEETNIYIKTATGIKKPSLKPGDQLTVIGIVGQTSAGYRVLPRYQTDLEFTHAAIVASADILGAAADQRKNLITYLGLTAGALLIILVGTLIKYKYFPPALPRGGPPAGGEGFLK